MAEIIRLQQNVNKNLLGFIPSLVIQHILSIRNNKETIKFPQKTSLKTVIMFADVNFDPK
jgi:hypothetical protein